MKLDAKTLRHSQPTAGEVARVKKNPIYLVVDEVLDTYNVGSLFRLADATAMTKVFLCGEMEYPPSTKIHRAAIGTETWVPWEKADSTLKTIKKLKKQGVFVVAVEQDPRATDYRRFKPHFPLALVVGHETKGVSAKVLAACDAVVELPMLGINKSFNVWGSAAVVAYKLLESLK